MRFATTGLNPADLAEPAASIDQPARRDDVPWEEWVRAGQEMPCYAVVLPNGDVAGWFTSALDAAMFAISKGGRYEHWDARLWKLKS